MIDVSRLYDLINSSSVAGFEFTIKFYVETIEIRLIKTTPEGSRVEMTRLISWAVVRSHIAPYDLLCSEVEHMTKALRRAME